jgi:hypothetical protein
MPRYKLFRGILYCLCLTLIFEGLARKLAPESFGMVIFFIKDVLCVIAVALVLSQDLGPQGRRNSALLGLLCLLCLPSLIQTGIRDLVLFLWGGKQYLLYGVVYVCIAEAFPPGNIAAFSRFCTVLAVSIIPTTLVAMLQNQLPGTHWLNLAADRSSLETFVAGGKLRVSSTFSFTAQYSHYLLVMTALIVVRYYMPLKERIFPWDRPSSWVPWPVMGTLLMVGAYVTGGRTAVLGVGTIALIGGLIVSIRLPSQFFQRGLPVIVILSLSLLCLRAVKPDYFAAYDARSEGYEGVTQKEEITGRLIGGNTSWLGDFWHKDPLSMMFGEGMGVMSNGVDKLSSYAKKVRAYGFWTESDIPTTAWEGGLYLVVVWYGFRLYIIYKSVQILWRIRHPSYFSAAAFLFGFVFLIGVQGTLAIQPPLAIWWWTCAGSIQAIGRFDSYRSKKILKQTIIRGRKKILKSETNSTGVGLPTMTVHLN